MLIECTVKRDEPIIVPIGNEKYTFDLDAKGRRVAEVWLEDHIEMFLAVSTMYRPVKDPASAPMPPKAEAIVTVSDDLPRLRAEYHKVTGKRAFNGWNAESLRERIAEARA